jgi:hypothetical protein
MSFDYHPLDGKNIREGWIPWRNVQRPVLRQWQITLDGPNAFVFGAVLAIFVIYAGSRFWRVLVHPIKPGVQLDAEEIDDIG